MSATKETRMVWYAWLVVVMFAANTIAVVWGIDKPRQPTTRTTAISVMVVNGLTVWAILALGGVV